MFRPQNRKDSNLRLLYSLLDGSKRYFILGIFFTLLMTAVQTLIPKIIQMTVDCIIGDAALEWPQTLSGWVDSALLLSYLREHLWILAFLIGALALLMGIFRYGSLFENSKGAETLAQSNRNRLYTQIQRLPCRWHSAHQTGDIIQRCTSDVDVVTRFVSEQLVSIFSIVILVAFSVRYMYSLHTSLASLAAASVPVIIAYSTIFHLKISKHFRQCDESEGKLSSIAQENLTGVRVVRAFGRERSEKERFEKQNSIYSGLWMKVYRYLTTFWCFGDLISGLQVMLIVVIGSLLCLENAMTCGELIAFISYNTLLIRPVRELGRVVSEMSKAGVAIERIGHILRADPENVSANAPKPSLAGADICFEHVTFSYENDSSPVLKDVSLRIPGGSVFGILGGTGSGKSTLVQLLDRLYELPENGGRITIGGMDIAEMDASHLRQNIGLLLQEPFLFTGTLKDNIGIACEHPQMDKIAEAASVACMDENIRRFSNGYETLVGERGVTLSGGQKQRAAIARMLLQNAPIMIFDDSLSAVDAETDANIRAQLRSRFRQSTVILISHRITTLMEADEIAVLDAGEVVEHGNHQALYEAGGIYRKIYDLQTAMEVAQ